MASFSAHARLARRCHQALVVAACVSLLPACALLGFSAPRCPAEGGPAWRELRSPHFTLMTDLPEDEAQRTIVHLERLRSAMLLLVWNGAEGPSNRFSVISLVSEAEFHEYLPEPLGGQVAEDAFDRFAVVHNSRGGQSQNALAHELAHGLSQFFHPRLPLWLNEGFATYLENMEVSSDGATIDMGVQSNRSRAFLAGAARRQKLPVRVLFSMEQVPWDDQDQVSAFYASSWLLTHYLINHYNAKFGQLLLHLSDGQSFDRAWADTFHGVTAEALDDELSRYLDGGSYVHVRQTVTPLPVHVEERLLSDAEVHAWRARLQLIGASFATGIGHTDEARRHRSLALQDLAEALRQEPKNGLALALRVLAAEIGQLELAREATEAAPDDWRTWYVLDAAIEKPKPDDAEQGRALENLLRLAPDNPRALVRAAREYLRRGNAKQARTLAERAVTLAPLNFDVHDALAGARFLTGDCPGAMEAAQTAIDLLPDEMAPKAASLLRRRLASLRQECHQPAPPVLPKPAPPG
jgi:tetratricopeptide (TPR) repeat protein